MLKCKFCFLEKKNSNSLKNHENLCKSNPNRRISYFQTEGFHESPQYKNRKRSNQYISASEKGTTYSLPETARMKLSNAIKSRSPDFNREIGKKISATILDKVSKGEWHTSLAKRMHYEYSGIDLHGKWELAYAKYLDSKSITWQRCNESFPYKFLDKNRRYTPDFYLPDTGEYIEIKGYKTEKDEAKWCQFPTNKKLVILMKKELQDFGII